MLSVFTVISIPILIPFFQILFERVGNEVIVPTKISDVEGWIKYYLHLWIHNYGKQTTLTIVCCCLIGVFLLKNIFRYLALYFIAPLRNGIIYDLRRQLFNKYLNLPLSFYSNEKKGGLISSITMDVQEVEWSILNVVETVFKAPIIMIGCILFMLYISPSLTLFVFFLVLFSGVIIGRVVSNLRDKSGYAQDSISELTAHVEESLGGIRIIKSFHAEAHQEKKFDRENSFFRKISTKVVNKKDLASPVSEFLGVSVVTILMWYGSILVFNNHLAPETFFAFVFAFYQVIEPAKLFSAAYFNIQRGMAAMDRIDRILETKEEIKSPIDAKVVNTFNNKISFNHVHFTYKGADSKALADINFEIRKGQMVALIGTSGAGKSTIVDMLPRFYDPIEGSICIDGVDLRSMDVKSLRALYGIVSQEAILFNDTVADNITFGENQYTEEQVIDAAKIANAHEFINSLPDGYQTNIGDRGNKLSGGQKQRITIARAILRNPPILILDEATSALDSESERLVQDAISRVMRNRTSIVIAHRLSTIQNADLILVVEKGMIVQSGTHQELIKIDGPYLKFVQMQSMEIEST
jgi:subfamily B ATP-binding cassette protein MsbA